MKCLSVRQPWASLLVSGIKDVENRSWETQHRGKLLIHASSKRFYEDDLFTIPYEWHNAYFNGITTGAVPFVEDIPYSAIIGYVTIVDCTEGYDSPWSQEGYNWVMKDAYIFDKPILGVKGKLYLFDIPEIDENNLPPAHKVNAYGISLKGSEMIIKTTAENYNIMVEEQQRVVVYPTPELYRTLGTGEKENWKPGDIKTIRFEMPEGDKVHKISKIEYIPDMNENGDYLLDFDLLGNKFVGHTMQFVLG